MDIDSIFKRPPEVDPTQTGRKRFRKNPEEEANEINEIVDQLPEIDVPTLDEAGLKKMVLKLERSINKNQQMRVKYPDEADKFMESEMDLDEELKRFRIISTAPQLYQHLGALGTIESLLGLLSHENTDIAIDIVELLKEITDSDSSEGGEEETEALIREMVKANLFELLMQNIKRLDETDSEDSQGVFTTLALIENFTELSPSLGVEMCEKTDLLQWLLQRIKQKAFDSNKQYASEILAILMQGNQVIRLKVGEYDGIDVLLQCIAPYRKRDPSSADEIEYLENLFDCVCSAIMETENKQRFLQAEGLELMLILVKEKMMARMGALKVISFATSGLDAAESCNRFIEILGLKTMFAAFMKKGANKIKKQYKDYSEAKEEEYVVSTISSLLHYSSGEGRDRLLAKFTEENFEKLERIFELHFKYSAKVAETNKEIALERQKRKKSARDLEDEDEDEIYLRQLDGGLFMLQLVDLIIGYICTSNVPEIKEHADRILKIKGGNWRDIALVLEDYAKEVGEAAPEEIRKQQREAVTKMAQTLSGEAAASSSS